MANLWNRCQVESAGVTPSPWPCSLPIALMTSRPGRGGKGEESNDPIYPGWVGRKSWVSGDRVVGRQQCVHLGSNLLGLLPEYFKVVSWVPAIPSIHQLPHANNLNLFSSFLTMPSVWSSLRTYPTVFVSQPTKDSINIVVVNLPSPTSRLSFLPFGLSQNSSHKPGQII